MTDWTHISFPSPLEPGDTIGVTAPSAGVPQGLHARLDLCLGNLTELGFRLREGRCLRSDCRHVSGTPKERAKDLLDLWQDPKVKAILVPWGGELLIHLLPCIDFDAMAAGTPKWILGYSDTSTLLFALTLRTGVATAHGTTLMEMIPGQAGTLSQRWREVLGLRVGQSVSFGPSSYHQVIGPRWDPDPTVTFSLTEPTRWQVLRPDCQADRIEMRGRLIGGCMDTLSALVGTPFDRLTDFKNRFRHDGVLLYLENAESTPERVCRMLWQMRLAGWFDGLAGLLLGRSSHAPDSEGVLTYMDAVRDALGDLAIPIIYDMDIGHQPPQMTLVNGAMAEVQCADGTGRLILTLQQP